MAASSALRTLIPTRTASQHGIGWLPKRSLTRQLLGEFSRRDVYCTTRKKAVSFKESTRVKANRYMDEARRHIRSIPTKQSDSDLHINDGVHVSVSELVSKEKVFIVGVGDVGRSAKNVCKQEGLEVVTVDHSNAFGLTRHEKQQLNEGRLSSEEAKCRREQRMSRYIEGVNALCRALDDTKDRRYASQEDALKDMRAYCQQSPEMEGFSEGMLTYLVTFTEAYLTSGRTLLSMKPFDSGTAEASIRFAMRCAKKCNDTKVRAVISAMMGVPAPELRSRLGRGCEIVCLMPNVDTVGDQPDSVLTQGAVFGLDMETRDAEALTYGLVQTPTAMSYPEGTAVALVTASGQGFVPHMLIRLIESMEAIESFDATQFLAAIGDVITLMDVESTKAGTLIAADPLTNILIQQMRGYIAVRSDLYLVEHAPGQRMKQQIFSRQDSYRSLIQIFQSVADKLGKGDKSKAAFINVLKGMRDPVCSAGGSTMMSIALGLGGTFRPEDKAKLPPEDLLSYESHADVARRHVAELFQRVLFGEQRDGQLLDLGKTTARLAVTKGQGGSPLCVVKDIDVSLSDLNLQSLKFS